MGGVPGHKGTRSQVTGHRSPVNQLSSSTSFERKLHSFVGDARDVKDVRTAIAFRRSQRVTPDRGIPARRSHSEEGGESPAAGPAGKGKEESRDERRRTILAGSDIKRQTTTSDIGIRPVEGRDPS